VYNAFTFKGIWARKPWFKCFFMEKSLLDKVLDDLNWSILEELQQNSRLTAAEIGRRVGLSAPAVADRIQRLEEKGIIKGYQTNIDFDKLGLTIRAFILFRPAVVAHKEMIKMIGAIPEVLEWHTITGHYAVLIKIAAFSSEQLAGIIERLEDFGETNTSMILSRNPAPKIIRKDG
jgi:Lrp/AsnC family leucine-responsive transcriptional regulator